MTTTTPKAQFPDEQSDDGAFVRQDDAFRDWVRADGSTAYPAVAGRYHLYVSLACPWAHRTIIVRALRGLEGAIGMTVVDPVREEQAGWHFTDAPGMGVDSLNGFKYLREAYLASNPAYLGRVTVPILWDTQTKRIVSNSDDDIMRMFETEFESIAKIQLDLYPAPHRAEIETLNEKIYQTVNNGVYKAGFATSQAVYEHAVRTLFGTLDELEARLSTRRFLFGPEQTETDWRLFVTLIRFDAAYFGHFKTNLRRIVDYPNLFGYVSDLYQTPKVAETVNFDHIKRHYYYTHDDINPTRIVPLGPLQDFTMAHHREKLGVSQ
ncbi:MAG: glutathione S-transferase family protein [Candidatus Velthaea sp.]